MGVIVNDQTDVNEPSASQIIVKFDAIILLHEGRVNGDNFAISVACLYKEKTLIHVAQHQLEYQADTTIYVRPCVKLIAMYVRDMYRQACS